MRYLTVASIYLSIFLFPCAKSVKETQPEDPYLALTGEFVEDFLVPENEKDLRELLLTLPVFESSPESRRDWLYSQGIYNEPSLLLEGDGAQSPLLFIRTKMANVFELRIGPHEDMKVFSYTLLRRESGWKIIRRTQRDIKQ